MPEIVVAARSVSKSFGSGTGAVKALDDVSVDIFHNEFFTMLGPSGCGKTTLLRLIGGFEQATSGEILLEGAALQDLPPYKRPINTVFQSYALFPHLTVRQNITFGLEMKGIDRKQANARADEMLELVQLAQYGDRSPSQLSGGQQQRIALARALAPAPKVLLLDEPLSALDLKLRKEMQIELKRLQTETGITFVFVTHDQEEALAMSDRIAVMQAGHILQIGAPREIYEQPTHRFVADFIGESNFLTGELLTSAQGDLMLRVDGVGDVSLGEAITAPQKSGQVTVSIRPERLSLDPAGESKEGRLEGLVSGVVYIGTDTAYHIELGGGQQSLRVRMQNSGGTADAQTETRNFAKGDPVSVTIPADAARVLVD
ncbi:MULTISPECIES: ABC transporter ATP-binding protein [Thalassospira]|jgi:spermidine/putrescine transport system ATP-binding protein|uniref:ABC transporter ATP-binding protein n=3 Tax=Thalassospiraceae TaxID=2844866 RepID=UPI00081016FB|nr:MULTISPECIES: ABC transporter ATP-binding protein [Thalassospira]MAB31578.1 ABC transporter ATP-binding protein [Thalassospira sp.]MBA05489.1 ABC transporter ATP-binding protein [Thalassospira sp.]MDM7974627.1 ABC transporter ATP-binding protein [Thalassospira xiamenensis]OCK06214.1 spermidine/putrescine ABC transporter ATPase subunit [Thalassospira sp. KO164]OHZ02178.1 spermidine/putrescine ABC transporter ATP-binding protein [Thalassospira sp. MIT1004]|tara:strand:+ start:552 stop:1670 length:1119 start_codon:yes stop_codon:yes gene_type:complete